MTDIENTDISYDGADKIPIVETYINICNAMSFQGMHEDAIEYAEGGIIMSQRIIDLMLVKLENPMLSLEEKERLGQHYHHLINLNVLSLETKG